MTDWKRYDDLTAASKLITRLIGECKSAYQYKGMLMLMRVDIRIMQDRNRLLKAQSIGETR